MLHLYAQPDDPGYEAMQRDYANTHPNFHVHELAARSRFPMFEMPKEMARIIDEFAGQQALPSPGGRGVRSSPQCRNRFDARLAMKQPVQRQVHHRRREQGQHLAQQQAADDGEAKRLA